MRFDRACNLSRNTLKGYAGGRPAALRRPSHRQSGSSLIVSLIILIILMLLGVAAITISDTQFKLAGNLQFEETAMNNAEIAISTAETWLKTGNNFQSAGLMSDTCNSRSVSHLYPLDNTVNPPTPCLAGYAPPDNDPLTMVWDDTNSVQVSAGTPDQRYLIEQMSVNETLIGSSVVIGGGNAGCAKVNTYRITARGAGPRGATKFVQSFFSVLINNANPAAPC